MNTNRQILLNYATAFGAFLACACWIHADHQSTSICSFVLDVPNELSPASIQNALGQATTRHTAHIQILDGDEIVLCDDQLAGVVRKVPATIGNTLVDALEATDLFTSVATTLLSSRNAVVCVGEFAFEFLAEARVRDLIAIGQYGERPQSKVDPDSQPDRSHGWRFLAIVDHKVTEPLAGATHNALLDDVAFDRSQVAATNKVGDSRNSDSVALHDLTTLPDGEAVPSVSSLETRPAWFSVALAGATKELSESPVKATQGVAFYHDWNIGPEFVSSTQRREIGALVVVRDEPTGCHAPVDARLKCTVESDATYKEVLLKPSGLNTVWIQPYAHNFQHAVIVPYNTKPSR